MASHKRANFTNQQKAEIFVRDRAICAFSGKSLWVLDYGVSPTFDYDWADHIKPAAKGGSSKTENGICASSFFNAKKKDNGNDNVYFWKEGKPSEESFEHYEVVNKAVLANIKRFSNLRISDWYLNRAMSDLCFAAHWLYWKHYRVTYKRGVEYYSKAAWKMLEDWRKRENKPTVAELKRRQLIPIPLGKDHKIMLSIVKAKSAKEIESAAYALRPLIINSWDLFYAFTREVKTAKAARALLKKVKGNKHVAPRVANIIKTNAKLLYGV